jgi:hypothetical protein
LRNLGEGDAVSTDAAFSQAAEIGARFGERDLTAFASSARVRR